MYLNRKEERILEGEAGEITAKSLKLLVEIGKQKGAEELVSISRSHISGVSYKTAGFPMLYLLEDMAEKGVKVKTKATVNPSGMPRRGWKVIGVPSNFANPQRRIVAAYRKLGCETILSCTPYYFYPPKKGEIIAFAESSAICYVNSVIGAKTNRHGSLDALAASITGKVPKMELLLDKNRKPKVMVKTNFTPDSSAEFSLLGLYVGGKIQKDDNPIFTFPRHPNKGGLKALGSGLATSGAIALFHVLGITPEAKDLEEVDLKHLESFEITEGAIQEFLEAKKSKSKRIIPDLIAIGCPHVSERELEEISRKLRGRNLRGSIKLWIFAPNAIVKRVGREVLKPIEKAGGRIVPDTCPVVAPIDQMGIEKIVVNSAKAFSYIPRLSKGVNVALNSLDEIINRWTKEVT